MTKSSVDRFAFPLLLLANVALAFGPLLVREAGTSGGIGPTASAFWRLAFAAPMLLVLVRITGEARPPLRLMPALALAGLFFAADLAAWHAGIVRTRIANATLLANATGFLFPLYGMLVARRRPGRAQGIALALAFAGTVLLLGRSFELSPDHVAGDLLCVAAGLCYTAYLITLDRSDAGRSPLAELLAATVAGAPLLLLAARATGEAIWPATFAPLVLLAFTSQVVGQGIVLLVLRRVSATLIGLTLLLQPAIAAAIGWLVYGERLTAIDYAGALVIGVALVLVRLPQRASPDRPERVGSAA